jgi:formylmethanofuran dehydrogenase subunit B
VIDPRVTDCARAADIHAQPRPGTDGALALGFDKRRSHLKDYLPECWTSTPTRPAPSAS